MDNGRDRLLSLTGALFAVLLVAGVLLTANSVNSDATGAKVISYYSAHSSKEKLGAYLLALSVIAGLFFLGLIRALLRRAGAELLPAVGFGGAVLFGASGTLIAGSALALADVPHKLNPSSAQAINVLGSDFAVYLAGSGMAILLLAYGSAVIRSALLPRWLGWVAVVFAIVAITPVFWISLFGIAAWSLIASVILYARHPAPARTTRPPSAAATTAG